MGKMYTLMEDFNEQTVLVKIESRNLIFKFNFNDFLNGTVCFCDIITMYLNSTCVPFDFVSYVGLTESLKYIWL